jgi:hypothetical protein
MTRDGRRPGTARRGSVRSRGQSTTARTTLDPLIAAILRRLDLDSAAARLTWIENARLTR